MCNLWSSFADITFHKPLYSGFFYFWILSSIVTIFLYTVNWIFKVFSRMLRWFHKDRNVSTMRTSVISEWSIPCNNQLRLWEKEWVFFSNTMKMSMLSFTMVNNKSNSFLMQLNNVFTYRFCWFYIRNTTWIAKTFSQFRRCCSIIIYNMS